MIALQIKSLRTNFWKKGITSGLILKSVKFVACLVLLASCGRNESEVDDSDRGSTLAVGRNKLSESQVAQHLRLAGFPESSVGTMVCTAKYESALATDSTNRNTNKTGDTGLFQINDVHLRQGGLCSRMGSMFNAQINTNCALRVFKAQGYNAWYGFQKHRNECINYRVAGASSQASLGRGNTCNVSKLNICLANKGGHACYQKWSCRR